MANRIILKKSSVAGKVPVTTAVDADNGLEFGELALNYTDGKLYYRNANNSIGQIGGGGGSGVLRIFQRGDVFQEDAVEVNATSGVLGVNVRLVTDPSGVVGVPI